jgi:putative tryptophan/tyrosine transport system substrate-binding protein
LLGGAAAAWPLAALGQQQPAKLARIGFLRAAGPNDKDFTAFRSGLRALGYVEGQNIVIEQRYAAGSYDRVGELAAELVRLNVDVIVVDGPAAAKPAKAATADIPIVFTLATDPVADGLVALEVGDEALWIWSPALRALWGLKELDADFEFIPLHLERINDVGCTHPEA